MLQKMKISHRIGLLALVGMTSIVALSVVILVGNISVRDQLTEMKNNTTLQEHAQRIDAASARMQKFEKTFRTSPSDDKVAAFQTAATRVDKSLATAAALATKPEVKSAIDRLDRNLPKYRQQFQALVENEKTLGYNEEEGLQGKLRAAAHGIEDALNKAEAPAPLSVKMLMMRRHEKDFIMRRAKKYVGRLDKRRSEFDALLADAPLPAGEKATITALLDDYQASFHAFAEATLRVDGEERQLDAFYNALAPDIGSIMTIARKGQNTAETSLTREQTFTDTLSMGAAGASIALALALSWLIGRSITGPVSSLTEVMTRLSGGDTSVSVPDTDQKNEIGEMARAVEVFRQNAIHTKELEAASRLEQERAQEQRKQTMRKLADDLEGSVGTIVNAIAASSTQLRGTAQSMSDISEQASERAETVSRVSQESSANVQTAAAATQEMTASIQEISGQITHVSNSAGRAVAGLKTTNSQMQELTAMSENIGKVVSMISDIAEQTNLLALNATIESARAGEAGKGFAVVAHEVKALAGQTAKATEEIVCQIEAVQAASRTTAGSLDDIGQIIHELNEASTVIASAIEEQSSATQEIARNTEQASNGTREAADDIVDVKNASERVGAVSGDVLAAADGFVDKADDLKGAVGQLLSHLRAA